MNKDNHHFHFSFQNYKNLYFPFSALLTPASYSQAIEATSLAHPSLPSLGRESHSLPHTQSNTSEEAVLLTKTDDSCCLTKYTYDDTTGLLTGIYLLASDPERTAEDEDWGCSEQCVYIR